MGRDVLAKSLIMSNTALTYTALQSLVSESDPPTPAQALRSFNRLDLAARDPKYAFETGTVMGCSQSYLDVHLSDVTGKPLADVPVTLDFPAGGGRKGSTDGKGRAHFADLYHEVSALTVEILRDWPDGQLTPTYRARVIEVSPETEDAETAEPAADSPMLYYRPWDDPRTTEEDGQDIAGSSIPVLDL